MAEVINLLRDEYDIERRITNTRNPQANAILEHAHQNVGNIICTFQLHRTQLDMEDP